MIPKNKISLALISGFLLASLAFIAMGNWAAGLAIHLMVVIPLLWGTFIPNSRIFGPIQSRSDSPAIWLTIDDGPDPVTTPSILELLNKYEVKATFFVIGKKAQQFPDLIKQIDREGHQIGNHTWSHPQSTFWCKGPSTTYKEIEQCQQVLESILGKSPTLFRAPVGHHQIFVHPILNALNLRLIGWSSRGYDAVEQDLDKVILSLHRSMTPGTIVLAHEATPAATKVIESILIKAKENRWSITIPDVEQQSGNY